MLLVVLNVESFEARDEGVTERFDSIFRLFAGGAFFVVAMPFLGLAGAGRFFDTVGSGGESSVDCTGTEDSRSGEAVRRPCSFLSEAMALTLFTSVSTPFTGVCCPLVGEDGCGVASASCLTGSWEDAVSCGGDWSRI